MHSHHSHSGDYVAHAKDTLDLITQRAIEMKFSTFCLTEHMPRTRNDYLYPEEIDKNYTTETLQEIFDKYYHHASKIQLENKEGYTKFLVGTELEGDLDHVNHALTIREQYNLDLIVGSVHFVNNIPIDFNRELFLKAMESSGSFRNLFKEYFECQYSMLVKIKPEIVGHFDLIRLMLTDEDYYNGKKVKEVDIEKDWPEIWQLIIRNIKFIESYGGLIELNSAAIRKGWDTPYPKLDICNAIIQYGDSNFCLSDDSHSIDQVGLNYSKVLDFIEHLKLDKLWYLDLSFDGNKKIISKKSISIDQVKLSPFFTQLNK